MAETTKVNASTVPTNAKNVAKKATLPKIVSASTKKVMDKLQKWVSKKTSVSHEQKLRIMIKALET